MNSSLSVLLPVHNSQATLSIRVQRVLDVLPELTHRFEVVIVDDGSTDATCEVAYELARDFPQVNVFRNAVQQGWAKAVTTPALRAAGDFVMIHCGGTLETDDIVGLWRLRDGIAAAAIAKAKAAPNGEIAADRWRVHRPPRRTSRLLAILRQAAWEFTPARSGRICCWCTAINLGNWSELYRHWPWLHHRPSGSIRNASRCTRRPTFLAG